MSIIKITMKKKKEEKRGAKHLIIKNKNKREEGTYLSEFSQLLCYLSPIGILSRELRGMRLREDQTIW